MTNCRVDPIAIAEMIGTRICHDLAGPISAVNNGIELVFSDNQNVDDDMKSQLVELLQLSSGESLVKLQMFRMAYGKAAADVNSDVSEVLEITTGFFENSKLSIDWSLDGLGGFDSKIDNKTRRILVLMILVASSILIFGGVMSIRRNGAKIIVTGNNQRIKEDTEYKDIFCDNNADVKLTTNNVLGFYLAMLAEDSQIDINYEITSNQVEISADGF